MSQKGLGVLYLLALFFSLLAYSWGNDGHHTVGRLAQVFTPIGPAEGSTSEALAPKGEVLVSGICEERSKPVRYKLPQSTSGYASLGDLLITQQTETVPLRKNIGFGLTWRATGLPEKAHVTYVFTHPAITRPDGLTLERFEKPFTHKARHGIVEATDCNFLSDDHELVPGIWTISIVYNGATLVKRSYRVEREPDRVGVPTPPSGQIQEQSQRSGDFLPGAIDEQSGEFLPGLSMSKAANSFPGPSMSEAANSFPGSSMSKAANSFPGPSMVECVPHVRRLVHFADAGPAFKDFGQPQNRNPNSR